MDTASLPRMPDESQLGSDSKRQKVEECDHPEDVKIEEAEEDDSDDSSSSDDGYDFASCFDFYVSVLDTEGAECRFPDHGFRHIDLEDPEEEAYHVRNVKKSAKFVIHEQYKMGNKLKLVKIEKASSHLVNGYNYYITFSAETWPTREIKVYQAEVYCNFMGKMVETTNFREKPPPHHHHQPQSSGTTSQQVQGLGFFGLKERRIPTRV
ncbi:unnamed protein product [Linum tenue]|uniref:Cystatin domain-containing protein n=1 Tax=Linum tenue TaxID=586396 RepID=A0AAV0L240_9ROSI|nr:unnamed protein product [Linum tenue]